MKGNNQRWPCALLCVAAIVVACRREPAPAAPDGEPWPLYGKAQHARSNAGVVVSGHPLASRAGAAVLERGGNAVDAAVAVAFALAAVLPEAGNIGGGGFLVYRSAGGEVKTLDFRERAPLLATHDMFLDAAGNPTKKSVVGHLAAGVPGSVAGLWEMHERLGSLPWRQLVEPAVELAQSHAIDEVRSEHLAAAAERLASFPASAAQFLPDGKAPAVGTQWSQPALARTLARIRDDGADGFYRGETSRLIVEEMRRGAGIVSARDLEEYAPVWREPVVGGYRGYTVYSMPPPSSGGVTLTSMLNVLEGFELPEFGSARLAHLETESMRRAFIDRNSLLGDPDFVEMPLERLQSQAYADELRAQIDPERATPTPTYVETSPEGTNTTHFSVVDGEGNAVAVTTTLNSAYGSAVTVTGAGFLLNNEMDDFAAAPGKPNQFGLVEGENNAVAPGKRMLSSMTPSVVVDPDGDLFLVVGSPGGPTIITTVYHVISNMIDHGMTLQRAVEAPRIHHQALPDVLFFEHGGLSPAVQALLREMGHELNERNGTSGDAAAIARDGDGWVGVADPRRGAAAVGAGTTDGASTGGR